ncbi:contractile injection system protein, VgrG/Pvc8 family [Lentzea sp. BCCO 10_0856]|uniref:Contractile injection system protein, VgrG/Pvc8 family n=1 Tax=Lentzea miocenica TaxID=3095431 RepID=A0ABU4SZX6_9PSEU|nr:contractile injection system protein, VgrG/Pvc8 family [Lentzea sp. BCCO 10_0856]MDX8031390.1 contractile injection system protein, VgrG/Pvc8 family [Lentzea sp. BCCO 10_0856]
MADQFVAADPVFTVDGRRVPDLGRDCLALVVEESTEGLRTCVAHLLANAPRQVPNDDVVEYLDGRTLDFGKQLAVSIGPSGNERVVFAGAISAIEAVFDEGDAPHVSVYAEDALMKLRQTRRSATYTRVSDADIVRRIAARHGLSAQADVTGPTYAVVQQVNETDLGFLRDRAARLGAELWAAGTTLHFATRDRRTGPAVTLAQGKDLLTVSLRADLAHQRGSVGVSGYDAQARERIDVVAGRSAVTGEISGGRSGLDVLEQTGGTHTDQRSTLTPVTGAEARAWAEADLRCRARRFVTVVGTASGVPELSVGARLTLTAVGAPFAGGGYYVTRARHTFARDEGGLRVHFTAERATLTSRGSR